jgi:hypothetical protein
MGKRASRDTFIKYLDKDDEVHVTELIMVLDFKVFLSLLQHQPASEGCDSIIHNCTQSKEELTPYPNAFARIALPIPEAPMIQPNPSPAK